MSSCPLHAQHMKEDAARSDKKFAEMKERGALSMAFDQEKTRHHFRKLAGGGMIEVTVKDPSDAKDLAAIRRHLRHIADQFAQVSFSGPLATHGEMPAGAAEMQRLKSKIAYSYEDLPQGARVNIYSKDPEALKAVHAFLAYQISDHRKGCCA